MNSLKFVVLLLVFMSFLGFVSSANLYNSSNNVIYECGNITESGDYFINQTIEFNSLNCILVKSTSSVKIEGNGNLINYTGSNSMNSHAFLFSSSSKASILNTRVFSSMFAKLEFSDLSLYGVDLSPSQKIKFGPASNYTSSLYYNLNVKDQEGNDLSNVNVNFENERTGDKFMVLTDSNGDISTQILEDYSNNNGVINDTIYNITVSLGGYDIFTKQINLTANLDDLVILNDNVIPNITLLAPVDAVAYTSNSQIVDFEFFVEDKSSLSCEIDVNGIKYSPVANGSNYSFAQSFVPGSYVWFVVCNDSANNSATSLNRSFTVTAPVIISSSSSGGSGSTSCYVDAICTQWSDCIEGVETCLAEEKNGAARCSIDNHLIGTTRTCTVAPILLNPVENEEKTPTLFGATGNAVRDFTGAATGVLGETGLGILGIFLTLVLAGLGFVTFKKAQWRKVEKK